MQIQNNGNQSITIRRFDTQTNITIDVDEIVDVDEDTANYLISMNNSYDEDDGTTIIINFELI